MEYRYLREWVEQNGAQIPGATVGGVKKFQDVVSLHFKGQREVLNIVLDSSNPFLFFSGDKGGSSSLDNKTRFLSSHLVHARLKSISIDNDDRIISLTMEKTDIYNKRVIYSLILELIPHQNNIILTQLSDGNDIITDCWRYITLSQKSTRQVLPGAKYLKPLKPKTGQDNQDAQYLKSLSYPIPLSELLNNKTNLPEEIKEKTFNDINTLFEFFFNSVLIPQRLLKITEVKKKNLIKEKRRNEKKLEKLSIDYEESRKAEQYKKAAELLKVNLNKAYKGMNELEVIDYFSPAQEKTIIVLQSDLSPLQNMNLLFKKYRKGIKGREIIKEQISKTEKEIEKLDYELSKIEVSLQVYAFDDLKSKNTEHLALLTEQNIASGTSSIEKKTNSTGKSPRNFRKITIDSGWDIFIGKTNRDNDELTCRLAKPHDWWFHSRIFHGAHVILRNYRKQEPSPFLTDLCCRLAAYYSKAKNSENVPVDYTQIRYVNKPSGSPPGYVIYKKQKTMFVNPLSLREASQIVSQRGL